MLSFFHSKGQRRLLQAWFVLFLLPYFGNDNSGYKLLDEQWIKYFDQMHYVYLGNKTKRLYVESLNKFKMSNYISNTFNYNIRNSGNFLKYTYNKL